jgi:hypothetical protein
VSCAGAGARVPRFRFRPVRLTNNCRLSWRWTLLAFWFTICPAELLDRRGLSLSASAK